jgi:LysM repeat protein
VEGQTLIIPAPGAPLRPQTVERPAAKQEKQTRVNVPAPPPAKAETPNTSPGARAARAEPSPVALQDGEQSHIVQKGDMLNKIAARYGISPNALMRRNSLPSPDHIILGHTLIIPAPAQ